MDDIAIINAKELLTLVPGLPLRGEPHKGKLEVAPLAAEELGVLKNASISIKNGRITSLRQACGKAKTEQARLIIDASNKVVMPGFVDPHTHLVFAGSRAEEFEIRLKGEKYKSKGILDTVKATRKASEQELFDLAKKRLDYALRWGTTTIEIKSGYGLSIKDELKMLKVINALSKRHPITIIPTFLGAHEVPPEKSKKEYIKDLLKVMPEAAKLAKFCDVFCEKGVFTKEESRIILKKAKESGLALKIHADEIYQSGGSELAGELGAVSADHLVYPSDKGLLAMKKAGTVAVLLPGSCLVLGHKPPVKKLLDAGIPIAIGSDFNPGSSPVLAMPIIIGIGANLLKLTPAQLICASTINAAYALGLGKSVGSLEVGKKADILILKLSSYKELPYWFGFNPVEQVIKEGKVIIPK